MTHPEGEHPGPEKANEQSMVDGLKHDPFLWARSQNPDAPKTATEQAEEPWSEQLQRMQAEHSSEITWSAPSGITPEDKENLKASFLQMAFSVPVMVASAYVGRKIWNWFIPDIFKGAPQLSVLQSMAIASVARAFRPSPSIKELNEYVDENQTRKQVAKAVVAWGGILLEYLTVGAVIRRLLDRKAQS